ncbi:hypothetical protein MSG28_000803 [Choristoneura fumiferana]|uniref:Uncharacterized protein n=1 Tax=Choristoneura fumiferana TaxID=7141 RepID=A0ACC0K2G7_CHOFU|nr:hypothetical protein MSG28_000803 [Choristoneura fumiferana]
MSFCLLLRSIAVIQVVLALRVLPQERSDYMNERRASKNMKKFDSSNVLLDSVMNNLKKQNRHNQKHGIGVKILRHDEETTVSGMDAPKGEDLAQILREENELKGIGSESSVLLERPYIQHKGKHDFLVMESDHVDPFVTVVPNNIYYNVEKPCVNWLDSCSLQGIRAHLLQKVRSPFK